MRTSIRSLVAVALLVGLSGCGGDDGGPSGIAARAVFALIEPPDVRIYASALDGNHRTLLASERFDSDVGRSHYAHLLRADISDDGQRLAYQFRTNPGVFVVESSGSPTRRAIAEAGEFAFSPDGRSLLYARPGALPPCPPDVICEAPLYGPASRWSLHTLGGGDAPVDVGSSDVNRLGGWLDDARVLLVSLSNYGGFGNRLYVVDTSNGRVEEVAVPDGVQLRGFAAADGRAALILLPPEYGARYSCDIFEIRGATLSLLINTPDHDCGGLAWASGELWYGLGTGPNGRIDVRETTPSGYYILYSVHRFDIASRRDERVVGTDGASVYHFAGLLQDRAIVVSNERIDRDPPYRLEVRDLDGGRPRLLAASAHPVLFIGWLAPAR